VIQEESFMVYDSAERQSMREREHLALLGIASGDPAARFWISWLEDQGFCEYKLCLKCLGRFAPDSETTVAGIDRHAEIQAAHDAAAVPVGSVGDAVAQAVGHDRSSSLSEVYLQGTRLVGRVDEIHISRDVVHVIDNKPRPRRGDPFYSQQRQALGYAIAWSQMYPYYYFAGKIVAVVRDRDSMEWLGEYVLDGASVSMIDSKLDRIQAMLRDPRRAEETKFESKCRTCRYHDNQLCDRDKCR